MRTIEVVLAVAILLGGILSVALYTNLQPVEANYAPLMQNLGYSAVQVLQGSQVLQLAAFQPGNSVYTNELQSAMNNLFPPNVVYRLVVYNVSSAALSGVNSIDYRPVLNLSDYTGNKPVFTYSSSFVIAPVNFSFFERTNSAPVTVYILNTSDAAYLTQFYAISNSLKQVFTSRPYFRQVVTINNTGQFYDLMFKGNFTCNGGPGCDPAQATYQAQNSVLINSFSPFTQGDVPISSANATSYINEFGNQGGYAYYAYQMGQQVSEYNMTWISLNYDFQQVSNMNTNNNAFNSNICNTYPSFDFVGVCAVFAYGANCPNNDEAEYYFVEGLSGNHNNPYSNSHSRCATIANTNSALTTTLTPLATGYENYYGVYPGYVQSTSEAYASLEPYNLKLVYNITSPVSEYYTDAIWQSPSGGYFVLFGLSGFDARLVLLTLLTFYHPALLPLTSFTSSNFVRLVVLQLGEI